MELPYFGKITETGYEGVIADFEHFYYTLHYAENNCVTISVMRKPKSKLLYAKTEGTQFFDIYESIISWLKLIKKQISSNPTAFIYYFEKTRGELKYHAYYEQEAIAMFLELTPSTGNSLTYTFTYKNHCRLSEQDFQGRRTKESNLQQADHYTWFTGWKCFAQFFHYLKLDLSKSSEAFPTHRGINDQERLQLKEKCATHNIRYNFQKDSDGTFIQISVYKFYHFHTANSMLDAIIQEYSYAYEPSVPLKPGSLDLPF